MFRTALLVSALCLTATAEAQSPSPVPAGQSPDRVAGAAINVVDIERSKAFYTDVLGLKVAMRVPAQGPVHEYLLSADGGIGGGLVILTKTSEQNTSAANFGRLVLVVPDADVLVKRSTEAGYPASADPRFAHFVRDPDGFLIELFEMPKPKL